MRAKFTKEQYWIRMIVIFFAALAPYLCLFGYGPLPSLSSYWNTDMQPIFIVANATTSYYLYTMPSWKFSAILLLLLTAFSVDVYLYTHTVLAILFFIVTLVPMYYSNNYRWTRWMYLAAVAALPISMLAAEIVAITALCLYHGLRLRRVYRMGK